MASEIEYLALDDVLTEMVGVDRHSDLTPDLFARVLEETHARGLEFVQILRVPEAIDPAHTETGEFSETRDDMPRTNSGERRVLTTFVVGRRRA
jgi:hypothetical protein